LAAMRAPRDVRVPVKLSVEQVAALRRAVDAPDVLDGWRARARALATLGDLYARRGVTLRPEHHAWARKVLGVTTVDGAADSADA
jgi:hypothetical protein